MIVSNTTRRGATTVEMAVVLPVVCALVIAVIVGGIDVLRYQMVACLAREGARWASVRGADYAFESDGPSPTAQQIADAAVAPKAVAMDPAALTVTVEWVDKGGNTVQDWDASPKTTRSVTAAGEYVTNAVRVTVSFVTANVFGEAMTIQSVCEMPMGN